MTVRASFVPAAVLAAAFLAACRSGGAPAGAPRVAAAPAPRTLLLDPDTALERRAAPDTSYALHNACPTHDACSSNEKFATCTVKVWLEQPPRSLTNVHTFVLAPGPT